MTSTHVTGTYDPLLERVEHLLASAANRLAFAARVLRAVELSHLPPVLFSTARAAEVLSMTVAEVLEAIHSGALPARKESGRWAITLTDVVDFETRRKRR